MRLSRRHGVEDGSPAWSPNGRSIAFVRYLHGRGQIWVMHPDGRAARMLHADSRSSDEAPAWSHDGTRVAFVAHGGNRATIEVMSADGAHARRLTNSRLAAWNPLWLPHDVGIAFLASERGYGNGDLFVIRPDGRHVHQLTHWHGSARAEQFAWVGARYRYGRC